MAIQERIYTADDLWELSNRPENGDKHFELSGGRLIEMSPGNFKHGRMAIRFGRYIDVFVEERDLGYVTGAETGYILFKNPNGRDTVRAPDVGFVSKERLPDGEIQRYGPLAPDLAIEIVSPNDRDEEIQARLDDYLRYGVRLVVFVYSKSRTVHVHSPRGLYILREDDELDLNEVLPGFKIPVRKIFNL